MTTIPDRCSASRIVRRAKGSSSAMIARTTSSVPLSSLSSPPTGASCRSVGCATVANRRAARKPRTLRAVAWWMYTTVRNTPAEAITVPRTGRRRRVASTVLLLGLVSLITDLSQEMVVAVLPLYLVFQAGLTPLQLGLVDGLYQGVSAVLRLVGGLIADRRGRYKEVAALGYGASTVCKLGLIAAGGAWLATTGVLLVDRLGKGIRTAPRDALISLSSTKAALGLSFGVHRALDTVGALLGPLAAFILLAQIPNGFN